MIGGRIHWTEVPGRLTKFEVISHRLYLTLQALVAGFGSFTLLAVISYNLFDSQVAAWTIGTVTGLAILVLLIREIWWKSFGIITVTRELSPEEVSQLQLQQPDQALPAPPKVSTVKFRGRTLFRRRR